MPGKLMRYSGLITKTRAMSSSLLTEEDLKELTELATVSEVIDYLKGTGSYGPIYRGREGIWHRGQAEEIINRSLITDFEKIYRFADAGQRQTLSNVFFRYEVNRLKECLKGLFQNEGEGSGIAVDPFWQKHMRCDVDRLNRVESLAELEQALAGTPYHRIFQKLQGAGKKEYADYAMGLDIFYYSSVYKEVKRRKNSDTKKILLEIYGTHIDWLNILWIYRYRRFYDQTPAELVGILIPHTYRLKKEELMGMITAADLAERNRILAGTAYFKGKDAFVRMADEISYQEVIGTMYQRVSKKYRVSMAPVLRYLYEKEQEIGRLTTIIEGIRYQLPPKDLRELILVN